MFRPSLLLDLGVGWIADILGGGSLLSNVEFRWVPVGGRVEWGLVRWFVGCLGGGFVLPKILVLLNIPDKFR